MFNYEKIRIKLYKGTEDLSSFDCGHEDLNEFLKKDAIIQKNVCLTILI